MAPRKKLQVLQQGDVSLLLENSQSDNDQSPVLSEKVGPVKVLVHYRDNNKSALLDHPLRHFNEGDLKSGSEDVPCKSRGGEVRKADIITVGASGTMTEAATRESNPLVISNDSTDFSSSDSDVGESEDENEAAILPPKKIRMERGKRVIDDPNRVENMKPLKSSRLRLNYPQNEKPSTELIVDAPCEQEISLLSMDDAEDKLVDDRDIAGPPAVASLPLVTNDKDPSCNQNIAPVLESAHVPQNVAGPEKRNGECEPSVCHKCAASQSGVLYSQRRHGESVIDSDVDLSTIQQKTFNIIHYDKTTGKPELLKKITESTLREVIDSLEKCVAYNKNKDPGGVWENPPDGSRVQRTDIKNHKIRHPARKGVAVLLEAHFSTKFLATHKYGKVRLGTKEAISTQDTKYVDAFGRVVATCMRNREIDRAYDELTDAHIFNTASSNNKQKLEREAKRAIRRSKLDQVEQQITPRRRPVATPAASPITPIRNSPARKTPKKTSSSTVSWLSPAKSSDEVFQMFEDPV